MEENFENIDDDLIESFKIEFIKTLQELQIKRQHLEEYRSQVAENTLTQHELEHKLENEKRKNANDESENILMKNGNKALETERERLTKELAIHKSCNDMILAERDSLYLEARTQALANLKLKETVEDLERKHQYHLQFQDQIKEKLEKNVSALKAIMPTIVILQQKQENLQEMFDEMNKFETIKLTVKQIEKLKEEAEKQRDLFENQLIAKNAECYRLHELLDSLSSIKQINNQTKLASFWKEQAIYFQTQLNQEKESNENIERALRVALETEVICRKQNDENENIQTNKYETNNKENENKQMMDIEIERDEASK